MNRPRYLWLAAAVFVLLTAFSAWTQSRRNDRGPRALAVVDVLANNRARLTPVAILVDGKFYDANLYDANPRPMAVDSDVIYDVLRAGKAVGTFTVTAASDLKGTWVADGRIKALAPETPPSKVTLGKNAAKPSPDDEDKPPVLRRPEAKPTTPPGNTPSNSAPHAQNPPAQTETKPAESKSTSADEDEDRPTLKRGKPAAKSSAPETTTTLTPATPTVKATTAKPESSAGVSVPFAGVKETYTAISDVKAGEYRPYEYTMTPQDRDRFTRDLTGMALEAITRFTSSHPTAGVPMAGPLQDVQLVAYDLDLNNMPTIVLSASKPATARGAKGVTQPVPSLQLYVTVVARTDIYGNIRRLFTQVTDASHLDAVPRLELIDVVDAEATGRGQLLFRQINDTGARSFALYRVTPDNLLLLFEGGGQR